MKTIAVIQTCATRVVRTAASILGLSVLIVAVPGAMRAATGSATTAKKAPTTTAPRLKLQHADLPLSFEPNLGQTRGAVNFLSRGAGYNLYLAPDEALLQFGSSGVDREIGNPRIARGPSNDLVGSQKGKHAGAVVAMRLVGANPTAEAGGMVRLPGTSNYFIGDDPSTWRTHVPHYAKVRYEKIYPGIDLVYYGKQSRLEYDFVVAPGADPNQISLAFETQGQAGSDLHRAWLNGNGDLVIDIGEREVRFGRPIVYQPAPGRASSPIKGRYVWRADNQVGFEVGAYDRNKTLVIDPVLTYSTYLGGNDYDQGFGVAVDSSGNIIVAGTTASTNFPTANALQSSSGGGQDVFVTKFDPTGTSLIYSTYVGGTVDDACEGLAVDASGNAYVTGFTASGNFPKMNAIQGKTGVWNVFLFQLDSNGNLVSSTYYGGSANDEAYGMTLDSSGVYVVGNTTSSDYPVKNAVQTQVAGGDSAFLTKFSTDGASVLYSTYLGGTGGGTQAWAVAVDSAQSAYLTGQTHSPSFPVMNAYQSQNNATYGTVFLTKFTPTGDALVYSTYLGGTNTESGGGVFVDSSGNAYVTGGTESKDFPTVNPFQAKLAGNYDAFVTKFNSSGDALIYSTFVGGSDNDFAGAIRVDPLGNAYAAGYVLSTDFPTTASAFQQKSGGSWDAFVFELNSAGNNLIYSSYLGGSGVDVADALTIDSSGNTYVTGTETSTDFPVSANAFQSANGGGSNDAYLAVVSSVTTFPLAVTVAGTGAGTVNSNPMGIVCGTLCSTTFASGTVGLTANAGTGSTFVGWSGDCTGTGACNISASSSSPVNVTATFDLPDFSITPASTSMMLQAGGQGTDGLTVAGLYGSFGSAVLLTCTVAGLAPVPSCALSPTSVTPGASSSSSTLTVSAPTTARSMLASPRPENWLYASCFPLMLGFVLVGTSRRRSAPRLLCTVLAFLLLGAAACTSGGHMQTSSSFTVTVTGTSGTIQHTTSVAVTVQ